MTNYNFNNEKSLCMKLQCGCVIGELTGDLLRECEDHRQANFMN